MIIVYEKSSPENYLRNPVNETILYEVCCKAPLIKLFIPSFWWNSDESHLLSHYSLIESMRLQYGHMQDYLCHWWILRPCLGIKIVAYICDQRVFPLLCFTILIHYVLHNLGDALQNDIWKGKYEWHRNLHCCSQ